MCIRFVKTLSIIQSKGDTNHMRTYILFLGVSSTRSKIKKELCSRCMYCTCGFVFLLSLYTEENKLQQKVIESVGLDPSFRFCD